LLGKEINKLFQTCPPILLYIQQIIDDAKGIQTKRNLLLHGSLVVRLTPDVVMFAKGRRKKQYVIEKFTQTDVENLCADLAHLAGRMGQFRDPPADFLLDASWQDRFFLLNLLRQHRPPPTDLPTDEGQPIPFRE
jgi:hypothetical protein